MFAVNVGLLLQWGIGLAVCAFSVILIASLAAGSKNDQFEVLVPPEVWQSLSPAAKASFKMVSRSESSKRERFKKSLQRLASLYQREGGSEIGKQAYYAALLELLGKYTL